MKDSLKTMIMSEQVLKKDWDTSSENDAWKYLSDKDLGKTDMAREFAEAIESKGYKTRKDYSKVIGHIKYNDR